MNPPARSAVVRAIFWGGLLCGVLDIGYGLTLRTIEGKDPFRLLQMVAGSLLGPAAFKAGGLSIALGFVMHFTVAFTLATIYGAFHRRVAWVRENTLVAGLVFGACAYVGMYWGTLPLCALIRGMYQSDARVMFFPLSLEGFAMQGLLVGLPIALAARWNLDPRKPT
ncbi:MAG TPA: hypothetical protein VFJ90_08065 [Candidatus Didemnitutus sp.]|nr:hypothetical protein [Candidatus Didemnitutus sp.]